MKAKENGLTVCSFIFGVIAVMMIAMEYIIPLLLHVWKSDEAKHGMQGLSITFWFGVMAFGYFLWVASIVLIVVNLACNRDGIKTTLGRIGMTLNTICVLYHAFPFFYMIMYPLK